MEYLRGAGGKLSWQQIMLGLLLFPLLGGGLILYFSVRHSDWMIGLWVVVGSVAMVVLLIGLDIRSRRKPDLQPDLLASLVPSREIVQTGDAHFALKARQQGRAILLELLVQNVFDAPRAFDLSTQVVRGSDILAQAPPVRLELAGAGLSGARVSMPLGALDRPSDVAIVVSADTRGSGGRKVRFRRRSLMWKPPAAWMNVATAAQGGAIGGAISGFSKGSVRSSPHTTLTLTVQPDGTAPPADAQARVDTRPMWAPGEAADVPKLQAAARQFFDSPGPHARG
jgi:hypothetical protein